MDEVVQIKKTIYGTNSINNVIDTKFSQLVLPPLSSSIASTISVETFFNNYNTLFYDIPLSGSDNSHLGLAEKSLSYLGLSLTDLENEITELRQENVNLKAQILQLSNINIGTLAQQAK
jgi:hypothetical protein